MDAFISALADLVVEECVVQPESVVQAFHVFAVLPLLPVEPPEVHAHVLERMDDGVEVGVCPVPVADAERYGNLFTLFVDISLRSVIVVRAGGVVCHKTVVAVFIRLDSGGRVQVRTDPSVAYPIALTPVQQYNADNTTRTYIKGWYPSGNAFDSVDVAEGTASLTTNGVVTFAAQDAPDGTVDVLYANAIYGEADDKIIDNDRPLVFNHMTTQVNFTVVGTDGLNPAAELTALTLSGARGPISLSLVDDSVTWNTNEQEFELLDADPVVVPHADSSAAVVGFPLMIRPEANNTQLKVTASVDLDGAAGPDPAVEYSDLLLTTASGRFDAGTAYTIRLRVSENGIRLEGYIVPWNDGGTTDLDLF